MLFIYYYCTRRADAKVGRGSSLRRRLAEERAVGILYRLTEKSVSKSSVKFAPGQVNDHDLVHGQTR